MPKSARTIKTSFVCMTANVEDRRDAFAARRACEDELRARLSEGWAVESVAADTFEGQPLDQTVYAQAGWLFCAGEAVRPS